MLPYFIGIPIYKNICKVVFVSLIFLFFNYQGHAQSFGDPIVHITFGSGSSNYGPPLAADSGTTTYRYSGNISPNDGDYGIFKSTTGLNRGWVFTTDHTGDPNGYMMVVNASFEPGLFYTRKVNGLCGSTTYQFSAYIKNILKGKGILPNVNFSIEALDGKVLGVGATGDIQADSTWKQFPFTFTTPAAAQTIVLKMTNNAPGGGGNDLAIDDITFSPYGSQVTVQSDQANASFCTASQQAITIKTTTPLDSNYAQKLQANINGAWVDQGLADTASSFSFLSPTVAGSYSYRVVKSDAGNINTSTCVVSSNQLNITVLPLPVSVFSVADTTCQGDSVVFKDQSIAQGSTVASWLWSFGDGQLSAKQNPSHLYANGGNYTVKLTVTNSSGCISLTTVKTIHIISRVNTSFSYSTPDCETQAVTFTDASIAIEGNITSRVWDYGDSTTETKPDKLPFQHTFAKAGSYAVKLSTTNDKGCVYTLTKTVIVNPSPVVNFIIPPTCTEDFSKFIDSTTIADGTNLTYLWNFGDANSNAGNPNTSTQQNPVHRFIVAQNYQVTLTVTSVNGCQVTRTKSFMVNGSDPTAAYNMLNFSTLCSNREVFFVNHSYTTPGKITKIKWYFDSSDTTIQLTDNNPYTGKLYSHKYPAVSFPQVSKNYTVRMVAYSGGRCPSVPLDTTISILATPALTFNPPDSLCLNNGSIQLLQQRVQV